VIVAFRVESLGSYSNDPSVPPLDTSEAKRVRIWIPQEQKLPCRVVVDIITPVGVVVRRLIDETLKEGYYNYYWDKRDDSGRYVPAGGYAALINNCGSVRKRPLEAVYRLFEDAVELTVVDTARPAVAVLTLTDDSLLVRLGLSTRTGADFGTVVEDTVLSAGRHEISLGSCRAAAPGKYLLDLYINDRFVKHVEFRLRRR
jgi:hypothetical protein